METKEYILKIDNDSRIIIISGITSTSVSIDFSADIDFTRLVNELTQSIDSKKLLAPNSGNDTSDDSTMKLILETIDSIIKEYNNTITSLYSENSIIEQTETTVSSNSVLDNNDDLPF